MKQLKNLILIFSLTLTTFTFAQSSNMGNLSITCNPFSITEPFDGAVFKEKVDIFVEKSSQTAFAVFSTEDGENTDLFIGKIHKANDELTFISNGSEARVEISIDYPRGKSNLKRKYLHDGQWVEYLAKPSYCYYIQHGSEGVHN